MFLRVVGVLGGAVILSGCAGIPSHRASQHRAGFNQWDSTTQQRLLAERVQVGDSREMVYVALGTPLKAPTLTADQPPLEQWEYLAYETDPPPPQESSANAGVLRAQTINNVVIASPTASLRLVVVDFSAEGKLVKWKVYSDAQGRIIPPGFQEIQMPASPHFAP